MDKVSVRHGWVIYMPLNTVAAKICFSIYISRKLLSIIAIWFTILLYVSKYSRLSSLEVVVNRHITQSNSLLNQWYFNDNAAFFLMQWICQNVSAYSKILQNNRCYDAWQAADRFSDEVFSFSLSSTWTRKSHMDANSIMNFLIYIIDLSVTNHK